MNFLPLKTFRVKFQNLNERDLMELIFRKFSKIFGAFKKNESSCEGCAYFKEPSNCNLFVITEDWISVKAKDGCENYLSKNELLKRR